MSLLMFLIGFVCGLGFAFLYAAVVVLAVKAYDFWRQLGRPAP